MECTKYVTRGLPGTQCTRCNGKGEVRVKVEREMTTIDCPECRGRGHFVTVQTINRNLCRTCKDQCGGQNFDPDNSFVMQSLGRLREDQAAKIG